MTIKRTAAFILLLLLTASAFLFSGCEKGSGGETGAGNSSEAATVSDTDSPTPFALDGEYVLVRSEKASDELVKEFSSFRSKISEITSLNLETRDDWLKPGDEPAKKEILFGKTNREESAQALSEMRSVDYCVRVAGDKIVICGHSDKTTLLAAERFLALLRDGGVTRETNLVERDMTSALLTLNGSDISRYRIVYQNSRQSATVKKIVEYIADIHGAELETVTSKSEPAELELVFGNCGRGEPDFPDPGADDYACFSSGGRLFFLGGSPEAQLAAFKRFLRLYTHENVPINLEEGKLFGQRTPSRDEYIKDPSLFPMRWEGEWDPPLEMLDYQLKIDTLMQKDKNRIFTVSHRGDFLHYPENSIESMISVWKMGGDCVEIDLQFTRDGKAIVMHDATLTRMTNCADYIGKAGYPDTANISDWTLEQLKVLFLKEGQGGSSAALSSYRIPTLEEALTVSKGRFFLILDKPASWRYVDIPGLQPNSQEHYIYPYMKETGNFESVLISYGTLDTSVAGTLTAADALKIQKYVYDSDGAKMYFYLRGWTTRSTADPYAAVLASGSLTNSAILVNGAFNPSNSSVSSAIKSLVKKYPSTLFGGWTIDSEGYDCPEVWQKMYSIGLRSIMTNNMFGLVQFATGKIYPDAQ